MIPGREPPAVLNGWKEISDYLGKSVRTVQRWERDLKLPVRRVAGSSSYSVYADRAEIDRWLRENRAQIDSSEASAAATPAVAPEPIIEDAAPPAAEPSPIRVRPSLRVALTAALGLLVIVAANGLSFRGAAQPRPAPPDLVAMPSNYAPDVFLAVADTVVLVDPIRQRIVQRFPLPESAPYGSFASGSVSADGRYFVLTTENTGVIIFDMLEQRFGPWLPVKDRRVSKARLTTDSKKLLVLGQLGRLLELDPHSGAEQARVSIQGQVFDAVSNRADTGFYVPNRDAGFVSFIDAGTFKVSAQIDTGLGAHDIATISDVSRGFVSNEYAGTVSCLDLVDAAVIDTVGVGKGPQRLAVSADDETVYVSNTNSGSVTVLDATSCRVRSTIQAAAGGERPGALATTHDSRLLIVAGFQGNGVFFLDVSGPAARPLGHLPTLAAVTAIARRPIRRAEAATSGADRPLASERR